MSFHSSQNGLLMKRLNTSFNKTNQINSNKNKKYQYQQQKQKIINKSQLQFNFSLDIRNHMLQHHDNQYKRIQTNQTIQMNQQINSKRRKSLFIPKYSKTKIRQSQPQNQLRLIYGSSTNTQKTNISNFQSQKAIKNKRRRLSLSSKTREFATSFIKTEQNESLNQNFAKISLKNRDYLVNHKIPHYQSMDLQKQAILIKCSKIKQLLAAQKYSEATIYLKQVIPYIYQKQKKKQMYFLFIVSMIKLKNVRNEIIEGYIIDCLQQFPSFYAIYIYWGKLKISQNKIDETIQIYQKTIRLDPTNQQAYLQLSSLYQNQQKTKKALDVLKQGFISATKFTSIAIRIIEKYKIFKISLILYQDYSKYIERIQQICEKQSTEYFYIQGFIEKQKNNINQSLIYFLQSLKYNSNKNYATKSLQNVIIIQIQKRDFYAAYHQVKRTKHLRIDLKKIQKYQIFLQGVNFIMKKQYQQGIKLLINLQKNLINIQKNSNNKFVKQFDQNILFKQNDSISSDIICLIIKYMAYAYFKIGNQKQTIKCYKMLQSQGYQLDKVSYYNLLLAEGIILADYQSKFDDAIDKFQLSKNVMNKVQPWIYHSIAIIQTKLNYFKQNRYNKQFDDIKFNQQLKIIVSYSLSLLQDGQQVNSSSSNLLYHRTIMHLFFPQIDLAFSDINLCIQKAEQNLPKYFYLRGLCYACKKEMKKAINQFSISISLNKEYSVGYLERAKCYFLCGQTQMGFHDLKIYIDQQPEDLSVHKWIGDLLFEGTSYNDSIKAYNQMGNNITLDALCMRFKAELRVGSIKKLQSTISQIQSHSHYNQNIFKFDMLIYNLIINLVSSNKSNSIQNQKLQNNLKKLNDSLQLETFENGMLFHLVDCMNLIGITNFNIGKYADAYSSFLIISEFFKQSKADQFSSKNSGRKYSRQIQKNTQQKEQEKRQIIQHDKLNIQIQQDSYNLRQQDVYYNALMCLIAENNIKEIKRTILQNLIPIINDKIQLKVFKKLLQIIQEETSLNKNNNKIIKYQQGSVQNQNQQNSTYNLSLKKKQLNKINKKQKNQNVIIQPRIDHSINRKFKRFQFQVSNLSQKNEICIKTQLVWLPYQFSTDSLSFQNTAKKLVYKLHTGYIDNMPEGPWIKRNQYGVIFTDQILQNESNDNTFILTTNRIDDSVKDYNKSQLRYDEQQQYEQEQQLNKNLKNKKKEFLKQMKLDLKIQNKLNKIIKKPQISHQI